MDRRHKSEDINETAGDTIDKTLSPAIMIDAEAYSHFLDGAELSEDDKKEFLETLWRIITEFVSFGFGVHPIQQAQKDKNSEMLTPKKSTLCLPSMVKFKHPIIEHENDYTAPQETGERNS